MKKSSGNNSIYALLILTFFAVGCGFGNIKAEENAGAPPEQTKTKNESAANSNSAQTKSQTQTVSVASVVGKYHYKTYKNGEGYDNSMEITNAGKGKLYVFISGTYNHTNDGSESVRVAEGKGDTKLRGNVADSTLVDEAGKPCLATITFKANEAAVKIPASCQFDSALDGVYKRAAAKSKAAPKTHKISFAELNDVVNNIQTNKAGERLVVTGVPASSIATVSRAYPFGDKSYKNLFTFEATDAEETVARFITSKTLAQNLEHNADREPAALRVTAVIIEALGEFDVDRMSFVTKIEGLSDDGTVIWTATGEEPLRVNFKN